MQMLITTSLSDLHHMWESLTSGNSLKILLLELIKVSRARYKFIHLLTQIPLPLNHHRDGVRFSQNTLHVKTAHVQIFLH